MLNRRTVYPLVQNPQFMAVVLECLLSVCSTIKTTEFQVKNKQQAKAERKIFLREDVLSSFGQKSLYI